MVVITAGGLELAAITAAVGSIDGTLGITLADTPMSEAWQIFSDAQQTSKITQVWDAETQTVFEGYTKLSGIMEMNGHILVMLKQDGD